MGRIGIALSGGGYRATLYHLGALRFLRDADLLNRVSHITSVSGGSIIAAHVVLNWDRYTGSEQEFDEAAEELLDFIRLDARNRIVRRFPLAYVANLVRYTFRRGWSRRLTRPGLLEAHYEKHLYGDKCLYELPSHPQLHMLATNINEGCLCSFTRNGMLVERRSPNGDTYFATTDSTLATVPMAVAASSAFPGFFPPIHLSATDVGADEGRFPPHILTDGGVYDNLGVRMFHHIQDSWIGHKTPLLSDDFVDLPHTLTTLNEQLQATNSNSRLGNLARMIRRRCGDDQKFDGLLEPADILTGLWSVIVNEKLYQAPEWASLDLSDQLANELLKLAHDRELEQGEHLWINRCLINAAAEVDLGQKMLQTDRPQFDTVIVSDAGKAFGVTRKMSGGGLVGTAMRASDILMDRVWKLEVDHFGTDTDFIFVPISDVVDLTEDPTALHPELQRKVAMMRTDLDRFSDLEISGLTRHGYGLMRKVCRSRPDLFGESLPSQAPWDPTSVASERSASEPLNAAQTTTQARELQDSARRTVFGRLLSWKDWPTYVYVPLLLLLFLGVPFLAYRSYRIAHRSEQIVDAITFSNPDFQTVLQLVRRNPIPGQWSALPMEEATELQPIDNDNFVLVTDTRILDLRAWDPDAPQNHDKIVSYRRMRVRHKSMDADDEKNQAETSLFRFQQSRSDREVVLKCDSIELKPKFRFAPTTLFDGKSGITVEAEYDLATVPFGQTVDVGFETMSKGLQAKTNVLPILQFPIVAETNVASMWILLPENRRYESWQLLAYDVETGILVRQVEPTYAFDMADGTLFGWMIVDPSQKFHYECRWDYRDK